MFGEDLIKSEGGVGESGSEKAEGAAGAVEAVASEILGSRKLLAVFARLCDRGKCIREIAGRDLPQSTVRSILLRLARAGVVEVSKGIDRRKRIYILSSFGLEVLEAIRTYIRDRVTCREPDRTIVADLKILQSRVCYVSESELSRLADNLGQEVYVIARLLNASRIEKGGGAFYIWSR